MAILISAHSLNSRFVQLFISLFFLLGAIWFFASTLGHHRSATASGLVYPDTPKQALSPVRPRGQHPIEHLIQEANKDFAALLKREADTLKDAARDYRKRRGRQPPPGFDKWWEFAKAQNVLVIEEFWDQIYHDLQVFWGASPNQLRNHANSFENKISIRDQTVFTRTYDDEPREGMEIWRQMLETIIERDGWLPDVDLPINIMDETRILAKWEDVREHLLREKESRQIVHSSQLKTDYQRLEALDKLHPGPIDPIWITIPHYWNLAVAGCHPESPARKHYLDDFNFRNFPPLTENYPDYSYYGYVQNWTLSKSLCDRPQFQAIHGAFVEPISIATTAKLIPLFSSSKLSVNNDILMPSPLYWPEGTRYSGSYDDVYPWEDKENKFFWRGEASGGRNREENWIHFHRHRFVNMVNATSVWYTEHGVPAPNYLLPDNTKWELGGSNKPLDNGTIANWLNDWGEAALLSLVCFPDDNPPSCPYTDPHFFTVPDDDSLNKQYQFKYLPDIDGNGYSARLRPYMTSNSVPIKSTVFHEWSDERLVPWKHFIPMDNTFIDFYGIMDFFVGNNVTEGHDALAKEIALNGRKWKDRVLRKEDMLIYMYRLVLEFARLCHDSRYKMGWSEDL